MLKLFFFSVVELFQETLMHKMRISNALNKTNKEELERRFLLTWYPSLKQIHLMTTRCINDNANNFTNSSLELCVDLYLNTTMGIPESNVFENNNLSVFVKLDQNETKGSLFNITILK